jgi:hypothetical protein
MLMATSVCVPSEMTVVGHEARMFTVKVIVAAGAVCCGVVLTERVIVVDWPCKAESVVYTEIFGPAT